MDDSTDKEKVLGDVEMEKEVEIVEMEKEVEIVKMEKEVEIVEMEKVVEIVKMEKELEIVEMEKEVEIVEIEKEVEIMETEVITVADDENEEPQQKSETEQQMESDTEQKQKLKAEDIKIEAVNHVTKDTNGPQPSTSTATTAVNNMITPSTSTSTIIDKTASQPNARTVTTTVPTNKVNLGDSTKIDYNVPDRSRGGYYCKLCNKRAFTVNIWAAHINGKLHKMNVEFIADPLVNDVTKDKNGPQPSTSTATPTGNDMIVPSTSTSTIINQTNPQPSASTTSINIKTEPQPDARIDTSTTVPTIEDNSGDATQIDYNVPDTSRCGFYCKLCDSYNYREKDWTLHVNGKKHIMKLNAGPVVAFVGRNFKYADVESKLMTQLSQTDHESAIVGLDFITETQLMSGDASYECHVCHGKRCSEADIIPHITGFVHQHAYIREVNPDWLKFKVDSTGPSARDETVADRAAYLEKQYGQGKIVVKIQTCDLTASQKLKNVGLSMKEYIEERNKSKAAHNANNASIDTVRPGFSKEYLQEILRHNPTSERPVKPLMKKKFPKMKKRPKTGGQNPPGRSKKSNRKRKRKNESSDSFPPKKKRSRNRRSSVKNNAHKKNHFNHSSHMTDSYY